MKISPTFVFIALSVAPSAFTDPAVLLEKYIDRDELGKEWTLFGGACGLVKTQAT